MQRRTLLRGAALLAVPGAVLAQTAGPLKLIVGFPPGGAVDVVARQLAEAMRAGGRTVVVENRPGAAGKIAIDALKAAAPDGETLMVMPNSIMAMERGLYLKPRFDLAADFSPVTPLVENSHCLAVTGGLPARTLPEFLAWAKAHPGQANFASPGQGTPFQFMGSELAVAAKVPLQHVPYKGGGQAMPDLISGQVASMFSSTPAMLPLHQRGQVRILAVSTPRRIAALPDVPTFAELGYPGLTEVEQFGVFAPAGTPPAVVAQLAEAIATAMRTPSLREGLAKVSLEPATDTPAAYAAQLRTAARQWEDRIRRSGFKPDA